MGSLHLEINHTYRIWLLEKDFKEEEIRWTDEGANLMDISGVTESKLTFPGEKTHPYMVGSSRVTLRQKWPPSTIKWKERRRKIQGYHSPV